MAASIALKDATTARGARDYISGSGFKQGHTVILFVNGNYAGVQTSGLGDLTAFGAIAGHANMPSGNPTGAQPVGAVDSTDGTAAATSVTLT